MGPIAPPPMSAIQEVKELLSLISDPKASKALLKQLSDSLDELKEAQKINADNLVQAQKIMADVEVKKSEVESLESALKAKEVSFVDKKSAIDAKEHMLLDKEKLLKVQAAALDKSKIEFDIQCKEALAGIAKSQALIELDIKETAGLKEQYQAKLDKLKAAMGS